MIGGSGRPIGDLVSSVVPSPVCGRPVAGPTCETDMSSFDATVAAGSACVSRTGVTTPDGAACVGVPPRGGVGAGSMSGGAGGKLGVVGIHVGPSVGPATAGSVAITYDATQYPPMASR